VHTAVEFKELSVGGGALRFDVHYNETLTRGRDIVGAISFFTQAFAKHLPASSRKAVFNFRTPSIHCSACCVMRYAKRNCSRSQTDAS
jgi:hypothetical protein